MVKHVLLSQGPAGCVAVVSGGTARQQAWWGGCLEGQGSAHKAISALYAALQLNSTCTAVTLAGITQPCRRWVVVHLMSAKAAYQTLLSAADLQKSMSGIAIDESCVNLFMHMKTRKQVRAISMHFKNALLNAASFAL
jgi:hypothetical protein